MIYIYTDTITERLKYSAELIFTTILNVPFEIVLSQVKQNESDICINYSTRELEGTVQIIPFGLLDELTVGEQKIKFGTWQNLLTFFHQGKGDIPFDIFSAVFFLVTRYEEYLPSALDKLGRFQAVESISFKKGIHKEPIVDQWVFAFAKYLEIKSNILDTPLEYFDTQLTIDVDFAWKYKNRRSTRNLAAMAKLLLQFKFTQLYQRIAIHLQQRIDPGYTFGYLEEIERKLKNSIKFFVLAGEISEHDNIISRENKEFVELIRELKRTHKVGFHPSFLSNSSFTQLRNEYLWLSRKLDSKVMKSRQHFLKLSFPSTYQNLLKLGIEEDYSMGWYSKTGFRAGIARPFLFFDLTTNKSTKLKVYPFQMMDQTLRQYMGLTPAEAILELETLYNKTQSVGGLFISIWHNDSVSDHAEWKGWRIVFEHYINLALTNQQTNLKK